MSHFMVLSSYLPQAHTPLQATMQCRVTADNVATTTFIAGSVSGIPTSILQHSLCIGWPLHGWGTHLTPLHPTHPPTHPQRNTNLLVLETCIHRLICREME